MRASIVVFLALLMLVIHRWANNEPALTLPIGLASAFVIVVIALLDQGRTEKAARGFAWLIFVAAAYKAVPDLAAATARSAKASSTALGLGTGQSAAGEGTGGPVTRTLAKVRRRPKGTGTA